MSEHTPAGRLGAVIGWVGFGLIGVIFAALSITVLGVHFAGWVFWLAAVALILGLAAAADPILSKAAFGHWQAEESGVW